MLNPIVVWFICILSSNLLCYASSCWYATKAFLQNRGLFAASSSSLHAFAPAPWLHFSGAWQPDWVTHTPPNHPRRSASTLNTHKHTRTKQTHTSFWWAQLILKKHSSVRHCCCPPLRSLNGAPQNTYRRRLKGESEDRYPPPCRASTDPDLSCLLKSAA